MIETYWQKLQRALSELFSSKKFLMGASGLLIFLAAKRNIVLSPEDANGILGFFTVMITGQAVSDHGKAAAARAAEAAPIQTQSVTVEK